MDNPICRSVVILTYMDDSKFRMTSLHWQILIDFLEEHPCLVTNRMDSITGRANINSIWEELVQKLNALGMGQKTLSQWKKVVTVFKSKTKEKMAKIHTHRRVTGGGPPCEEGLSDIEIRLSAIIGKSAIVGDGNRELGIITQPIETSLPMVHNPQLIIPSSYLSLYKQSFEPVPENTHKKCNRSKENFLYSVPDASFSSSASVLKLPSIVNHKDLISPVPGCSSSPVRIHKPTTTFISPQQTPNTIRLSCPSDHMPSKLTVFSPSENDGPAETHKKKRQLCFSGGVLLVFCSGYNEELKQKGELRKACSKRGHVRQPLARVNTTTRLINLRNVMRSELDLGTIAIDAYIVLSNDDHQSVEVDEYDRRREYITGFSGSYGDAIVTQNKAALWTDGRYHLQADEQIDCNWLLMREGHKNIPTWSQWLKIQLPYGGRVGVDPKIISEHTWIKLKHEFKGSGLNLIALNVSLVDLIWPDSERPERRNKDAFVWDIHYAGKNYTTKIQETRDELRKLGADAMVVTALDEVSWLLNIKGRDVPYTPFVRSYIILDTNDVFLYVNSSQLRKNNVTEYLKAASIYTTIDTVRIREYNDIWPDLRTKSQKYHKILVPSRCVYSEGASHAIYTHIPPDKILRKQSPIVYLKAVKNPTEIMGMRHAHIIDAAAVCDCLAYFEKRFSAGDSFTEMDMAKILDSYRYEQNLSLGNSFRTIVGFGPNAAQPHYEPTPNTNVKIFDNSTVVLDSGGQYYSGTTDITRTLHFGTPTEDMKEAYTRVLIGSIQLSTLTFPSTMRMAAVDVLARSPLWEVGLDYLHETGHGVGAFLQVRESPTTVQFNAEFSTQQEFKPGYFLSNEPGFYREGEFGVRLENVLEVIEKPWLRHTSGHIFLGFKMTTLVPYEPKLLKLSLLSLQHRRWLNHYNEQVRIQVGAELKRQNKMDGFYWMMEKTKYIPEYGASNIISSQPLLILLTNAVLIIRIFIL